MAGAAEGWAVLEAILHSGPAASILSRLMCGALGKTRVVAAGSEMTAAVADDTHQFCHRCDQLIASLEASDQNVPVEPAAAVKAIEASAAAASADTSTAVKAAAVSAAAASTAAAVKVAAVPPAAAARVAAATAGTAAAVKAAAHSGTEAALSPVAVEFGAGEQGEPLVSAHIESGINAELPSATATASQHSEGISTGVKPVSASRSEPEQLSQHDAALHELEAALLELTAAEEQVKPEGEQLQLAVDATAEYGPGARVRRGGRSAGWQQRCLQQVALTKEPKRARRQQGPV